jgi:rubrerythrin
MSGTDSNLQAAFAGESQASQKYLNFARKADTEGYPQVARLFRAAAEAEMVHARNHLEVMGDVKATTDNLAAAIGGEHYEFTEMYPQFIEQAGEEKNRRATRSFDLANRVEQIHHQLYSAALEAVQAGQAIAQKPMFVCQVCGNTVEDGVPDRCPVCGSSGSNFKEIA